ncbi:MAG TPA: AIR synthase-related protein [Candidatus Saccharimonadia bacterium]|nr:AIR synthase-related protein [Candidatus Saccharimonadia bacterium]
MSTYAQAGVDVDIEEQAAKMLYSAARKTYKNRSSKLGEVLSPFDDFSGLRTINVGALPQGTMMGVGYDGIGTKVEIAEKVGRFNTLAYDLLAMVCDDAVIRGGEPVLAGSILDVNTLGTDDTRLKFVEQLADGYLKAAAAAGVAIVNGEFAQLGARLGGNSKFSMSWGASVIWFANENRILTGHDATAGDTLVALREPGLRSNGISLVRRILSDKYGSNWSSQDLDGTSFADLALLPSIIYSPVIVDMIGGWDVERPPRAKIHAMAHITGSGLPGKLGRALRPAGLGAMIDNPMEVPELMLHCQEVGDVSDYEAYRTWHMGQGMVIATPEPHTVLAVARAHQIEAQVIGSVTDSTKIKIASRGFFSGREHWLEY